MERFVHLAKKKNLATTQFKDVLKSYPTHDNTLDSSVAGWMTLGQGFSLSPLLSPRIHSCYTCQRNGLQRSHRGATNNSSLSQANSLSAGQPRSMQPAGLCNQPIHGRKGWWYTMLRAHVMHQRLNEYLRCNDMENVVATQHFFATVQPTNNMVNTTSSTMYHGYGCHNNPNSVEGKRCRH